MHAMYFPQFHKFSETFGAKIQQQFEAGINYFITARADHKGRVWAKGLNKKRYQHYYAYLNEPQVLTMEHLKAGFVVWLVSICFAILSFLFEWIFTLSDLIIVKFVIKKCFELKLGDHSHAGRKKEN